MRPETNSLEFKKKLVEGLEEIRVSNLLYIDSQVSRKIMMYVEYIRMYDNISYESQPKPFIDYEKEILDLIFDEFRKYGLSDTKEFVRLLNSSWKGKFKNL